jgi:sugar phosphate isomerase/epimerase
LEKLRSKLAGALWAEQHWQETKSVDEVLQAVDREANAFMACIIRSMFLAGDRAEARCKKQILARSVALANAVLAAYLSTVESCRAVDHGKLSSMISEWSSEALERLARDIRAETGITVDLKLRLHSGAAAVNLRPASVVE